MKSVDPEAFLRAITFAKARCLIQLPRFALFFWSGGVQLNGVTCEILSAWWAQCWQDMCVFLTRPDLAYLSDDDVATHIES